MRRAAIVRALGGVAVTASVVALCWPGSGGTAEQPTAGSGPAASSATSTQSDASVASGAPVSASSSRISTSAIAPRSTGSSRSAATRYTGRPEMETAAQRPDHPPRISTGRYVRDLRLDPRDHADTMAAHGCEDARSGSRLVLLELGTQTVSPPRSKQDPGVLLTGTYVRLSYRQVRAALTAYIESFASCARVLGARIAVGTNNDGDANAHDRDFYSYAQRGADWYRQVVQPLDRTAEQLGLEVVGALDLEIGFASSERQAEQWEKSYLRQSPSAMLIENGSLDACPSSPRSPYPDCGWVVDQRGGRKRWTMTQYVRLTDALAPGRIEVLPQIYSKPDAGQWAMLDRRADAALTFAGVLTERASCPRAWSAGCGGAASLPPRTAWTALCGALHRFLPPVMPEPAVPTAVDLRVDPLPKPGRSSSGKSSGHGKPGSARSSHKSRSGTDGGAAPGSGRSRPAGRPHRKRPTAPAPRSRTPELATRRRVP